MIRWIVLCLFAQAVAVGAQTCSEDQVFLKGGFGQARFTVEIADDEAERALGLMHRDTLAQSAGMLFIYPKPQPLSFWMRNTLIELDMIFLDQDGAIRHIHHRAQPLDETPIFGGRDLTHVLEIRGGLAEQLGLAVGDVMRHPSFVQETAKWPC